MRKSSLVTSLYAWNDILWSLVLCFMLLMVVEKQKETESDTKAGAISIYTEWQHGVDLDVDLWIEYPATPLPLYYNRLQQLNGWIGRDDKGLPNSLTNSENAALYDLESGDYTINIHAFREGNGYKFPASVKVVVTHIGKAGGRNVIFDSTVELESLKQEVTVVRFTIDAHGKVSNVHRLYKNLINKDNAGTGSNPEAHQ